MPWALLESIDDIVFHLNDKDESDVWENAITVCKPDDRGSTRMDPRVPGGWDLLIAWPTAIRFTVLVCTVHWSSSR